MPESPPDTRPDPATKRSTIPFFIACCLFLIFMAWMGARAMRHLSSGPDFRNFYAAGVLLRTDPAHLYDLSRQKQVQDTLISREDLVMEYVHPSYEAALYAPFALLKYRPAYFSFMAFNVLLLVAVFFVARPEFSRPIPWLQPLPGLMFFLFVPVIVAVWHGQDSIFFLLLCCCAWRQLKHGKDLSAGCILALALFRFQLAIPIAVLIAVRRGWRFSAGFAATAIAVCLVCIGITGRAGVVAWFRLLSAVSLYSDHGAGTEHVLAMPPSTPLAMPNLFGLLYACGTGHLPAHAAFIIAAVSYLALFLWCLYCVRREPQDSVAFSIAILCGVLVSHHLYAHDATLLLLPIALLARRVHLAVLLTCYYLPMILFLFTGPNWFFLLAIPTMALLFDAQMFGEKNAREPVSTSFNTASATPLYTQD